MDKQYVIRPEATCSTSPGGW